MITGYLERRREVLKKYHRLLGEKRRFHKMKDEEFRFLTHHEAIEFFTILKYKPEFPGYDDNPELNRMAYETVKHSLPDVRVLHPRYFALLEKGEIPK